MKKSFFGEGSNWYKGNLHAHSTLSDGRYTPEERAAAYREHGYSFLALTDHNVFASYPEFCTEDFLMLPATERDIPSGSSRHACLHAVGISEKPVPEKVEQKLPAGRDQITADGKVRPWQDFIGDMRWAGQLVILAHPVWSRNTPEEFIALEDYIGIEVYNNVCEITCRSGKADYFIDCCLRQGKKALLFAQDDCHFRQESLADLFGGWIQVKSDVLTHEALIKAICSGQFYASTGPEIYDFGMEDHKIYIDCSPCEAIHFVSYEPRGKSFLRSGITSAEYEPPKGASYVRCECVDSRGRIAYTNPVYLQ